MLIKFLNRTYANGKTTGKNSVKSAIGYVLSDADCTNTPRSVRPEVVSGQPQLVKLLGQNQHTNKYTSLVLSFRKEEKLDHTQQLAVIQLFEEAAFSGLGKDEYATLWVKHEDKGRLELHCITPRVHMPSGKSLNIKPPGGYDLFDTLRDYINLKHGFAPVVPDSGKTIDRSRHGFELKKLANNLKLGHLQGLKENITACIQEHIALGGIKDRADILSLLRDSGFSLSRVGDNYISIQNEDGKNIRLKGGIYGKHSGLYAEARETPSTRAGTEKPRDSKSLRAVQKKLAELVKARAEYNKRRYVSSSQGQRSSFKSTQQNAHLSNPDLYSTHLPAAHQPSGLFRLSAATMPTRHRAMGISNYTSHTGHNTNRRIKQQSLNANAHNTANLSKGALSHEPLNPIGRAIAKVCSTFEQRVRRETTRGREFKQAANSLESSNRRFGATTEQALEQLNSIHTSIIASLSSVASIQEQIAALIGAINAATTPLARAPLQTKLAGALAAKSQALMRYQLLQQHKMNRPTP